ncbi:MAG: hypothetical protein U0900_21765 [Myxococcota bacterium]
MGDEPAERDGEETEGRRAPQDPADADGEHFPGGDQLIGTFLREPSLWPVLAVVVGSGGAFAAALIVLAILDRNPFAAAALLLIVGVTVDVAFRARSRASYRNGALLIGLIWLVGLVFTGLAVWSGIAFAS